MGYHNDSKNINTYDDALASANTHLDNNEFEKAYPYISQVAESEKSTPSNAITAGLVALTLDKKDDADKYFKLALKKEPENYDAAYNLALLEIEHDQYDKAYNILFDLDKRYSKISDLKNDLAVLSLNRNKIIDAIDWWQESIKINPNFSIARNNALQFFLEQGMVEQAESFLSYNEEFSEITEITKSEIHRWREILNEGNKASESEDHSQNISMDAKINGKKIVIFASIDSFIKDIKNKLEHNNEVKMFTSGSQQEMVALMEWADLAWFEWCDNFLIAASQLPKRCPIVCRLHSYEAFTDMPAKVDWSKVDLLLFVNRSVCDIFQRQVKTRTPISIIHNAVDVDKFTIPENKKYGKKIASVGYINYKKNPALLLYCFKKIYEYDNEYSLHIAGTHQDSRIELYFEHFLKENPLPIHFDGWVDDMPKWYADKDFVISTSLFESFHYSMAEGMASGIMPLIHNWYGARNIYPGNFLFADPDECLNLLKQIETKDRARLAVENRNFIIENYSLDDKINSILETLAKVIDSNNVLDLQDVT